MLNPFPQLLVYGFFAPTIVRVAVALVFAYLGWRTWRRARHLGGVPLPIIGAQSWLPYVAALAEWALAAMFFVGWYTQIAALLGLVGVLKYFIYWKWWRRAQFEYVPFSATTVLLVGAICLSLLLSGAGAHAFELP